MPYLSHEEERTIRDIYLKHIEERAASIAAAAHGIRFGTRYNDLPDNMKEHVEPSIEGKVYYLEPSQKSLHEALDAIEDLDFQFGNYFNV